MNTLKSKDLPPALRIYWETAPEQFRIPAILTAITCLCALGTRLRVKYVYDTELHALLLQVIVVGNPGDGKSFTRPIVKTLMAPLLLRDQELRRQEQAYNELKKTAAKNKQLPDEPITDVRCLQNITRAKLVKRADMFIRKYGEPLAFMLFSEELSTMSEGNKKAYSDLRTIGRLAYDLGAYFSTDTNSTESYCAMVDIIWCSLYCSTPAALDEYMDKRSIEGGNVTRHIIADLGDLMGDDAPVFRDLTTEQHRTLQHTVDRLMHETYTDDGGLQAITEVDMSWLYKDIRQWCQQQRDLVLKTGSRALNCFYKRSSVSAFRMTTMCYHLWCMEECVGCREERHPELVSGSENHPDGKTLNPNPYTLHQKQVQQACTRFYRFMAQYILDGLMARWGKRFEEMQRKTDMDDSPKVPLYDQLPKEFTRDQLREYIVKLDLTTPARVFLSKWKRARLIHPKDNAPDTFIKNF